MEPFDELGEAISHAIDTLDELKERYDLAIENNDPRAHVLMFVIEHKEKTLSGLLEMQYDGTTRSSKA